MIAKICGIAVLACLAIAAGVTYTRHVRTAAIEAERRERMADAIELIRETDKTLGTLRKASDADICRELGGKTIDGVCQ